MSRPDTFFLLFILVNEVVKLPNEIITHKNDKSTGNADVDGVSADRMCASATGSVYFSFGGNRCGSCAIVDAARSSGKHRISS